MYTMYVYLYFLCVAYNSHASYDCWNTFTHLQLFERGNHQCVTHVVTALYVRDAVPAKNNMHR